MTKSKFDKLYDQMTMEERSGYGMCDAVRSLIGIVEDLEGEVGRLRRRIRTLEGPKRPRIKVP